MDLRKFCSAWILGYALAATPAMGEEAPPIPDKPEAEQFKDVPAPWRDYLVKARAAERVADPLQRCLAYPDIPGNEWPQGHAAAHCRDHAIRVMALDEIAAYVDDGDFAGLDRRLDAYLQRHFSDTGFGEDIHYVFDEFIRADADADRISAQWLALQPDGAYANLARASFYQGAAATARGGGYAAQTPRDNLRRMTGFVDKAIPLFERAAELAPRLMPAYTGMLDVGTMDSRPELEQRAIMLASKQDPACLYMAKERMRALEPRWGGSYEEMLSLAAELSTHVAKRPQLAVYLGAPYGDRGRTMIADDQRDEETAAILDVAVRMSSNESYLEDAANVAFNAKDQAKDQWKALAYLLQETRFRKAGVWTYRNIADMLVRLEPEWSLRNAFIAEQLAPDESFLQYLIAAGYYNAHRYGEAEKRYLAALEDPQQRQASLRELVTMWMFDAGLERKAGALKARPYLDRLLAEYPDDGRAWMYRTASDATLNGTVSNDVVQSFLRNADRNDPRQAGLVQRIEEGMKHPEMRAKAGKAP
jgi:hypothetical protein